MDGTGRPKRHRGALRDWVIAGRVRTDDPDLLDALFLLNHPGWTWRALQETPADIIEIITLAESLAASRKTGRQTR